MKVTLTMHGGLAAGLRRPPVVIDSNTLPAALATQLNSLVDALQLIDIARPRSVGNARDIMSYTVKIEEGDSTREFRLSDADMCDEFADLLNWIQEH